MTKIAASSPPEQVYRRVMEDPVRRSRPGPVMAVGGGYTHRNPAVGRVSLGAQALRLSGVRNPNVLHIGTAGGDAEEKETEVEALMGAHGAEIRHLRLFDRVASVTQLAEMVLHADVIYVSGGNTANAVALWRLHGVVPLLAAAHARGTVCAGSSAGAICWFQGGLTDSFGDLRITRSTLQFVDGFVCPHYEIPERRLAFGRAVAACTLKSPIALGLPSGTALCVSADGSMEALTLDPDRAPVLLSRTVEGRVIENRMPARVIPSASVVLGDHTARSA